MIFINSKGLLNIKHGKKLASFFLTQKLLLPFSLWKKSKNIQVSQVQNQNNKSFLKELKVNQQDIISEPASNKSSETIFLQRSINFSKFKRKEQKMSKKIQVRSHLTKYQQFLFSSSFHQKGTNLKQITSNIQKIDGNFINKQEKLELISALTEIQKERQKILALSLSRQEIFDQLLKLYAQKSQQKEIKIKNYVHLYRKLNQMVENILINCQQSENSFHEVHYLLLNLMQLFSLREFYKFYLFKLLRIKDGQNINAMFVEEAKLSWFLVQKLPHIQFQFVDNKMSFDIQTHVQDFFQKKIPIIMETLRNKQKDIQNRQYFNSFEYLEKQVEFLVNLSLLFRITHLTFGNCFFIQGQHAFFSKFIKRNIHFVQNTESVTLDIKRAQTIVKMFGLAIRNLILDRQIISKFEKYLVHVAENIDENQNLSESSLKQLILIYEKIGSIPSTIYNVFLAEYIYGKFMKDQNLLIHFFRFYVYSECNDKLLLQKIIEKIENLVNVKEFFVNKKSLNLLHLIFHYLCIKYPQLYKSNASKKMLYYCSTHTPKNHYILGQIMKFSKKSKKSKDKKSDDSLFVSPCIQRQTNKIEKSKKSQLSTLQEKIFKQCLQNVIKKLNTDPNQMFHFEINQNFSFCSFQLDYVVLKWESQKKEKLFSYLDVQCVGLQYSYDKNDDQNQKQTLTKMQKMSLVSYQQGLQLIRKKRVREEILKHYGWKILYIPNKFLYQKNMGRQMFQQKLYEAILQKFSQISRLK